MAQVFISYSRKDLTFVERLAADLKNAGLDVWYDVTKLGAGSRWSVEIENALNNSQYVVVVLSPDSIKSAWVEREFLYSSALNLKIIPLMFRSCKLPLNYVNLNYVDVQGENYLRNFNKLLEALDVAVKDENTEYDGTKWDTVPPRPRINMKAAYIALSGAGTIVIAALLSMSLLKNIISSVPTPTSSVPTDTPFPTNTPFPTKTRLPLPAEFTDRKDGVDVEMVLVAAGEFPMGSDNGESDEQPVHNVYLPDYYIDKKEVTNSLYKLCVDKGGCSPPKKSSFEDIPRYFGNEEYNNFPVVHVTWDMALSYCEWRGASLPTETEWEKAARGSDERIYPWGDQFDGLKANSCDYSCNATNESFDDEYKYTSPVGNYPGGASPYGVLDLAGNVWEWVAGEYRDNYYFYDPQFIRISLNYSAPTPKPDRHIARGGSWFNGEYLLRSSYRAEFDLEYEDTVMGFRCARDATP